MKIYMGLDKLELKMSKLV